MTQQEAVAALEALGHGAAAPGRETPARMRALLKALGSPEQGLGFVHVAGTNGKGTTASLIASILTEAGHKTGLTVSPWVKEYRERLQVDGAMIPPRTLSSLAGKVLCAASALKEAGQGEVTAFEAATALAVLWFAREKCEVAVLETGMGGRFDATNGVVSRENCLASVVTRIGLDHTGQLGETLAGIAVHKAGILKKERPVIVYPEQPKEALAELLAEAARQNCEWIMPEAGDLHSRRARRLENAVEYGGYTALLPYPGRHQGLNAAVAVETVLALWRQYGIEVSDEAIERGLARRTLPARLEVLERHPFLVLDGSHNEDGARALAETLEKAELGPEGLVAIIGMMRDKNTRAYLAALRESFAKVYTVPIPGNPRALSAEGLWEEARFYFDAEACASFAEALKKAERTGKEGLVVCGSLYLAAQVRPQLVARAKRRGMLSNLYS